MTLPLFAAEPAVDPPHHCHARGCEQAVPPERLMCRAHWRLVPRPLQRAVWGAYRPGQCDDKRPSKAWHQAADAAIGFIAELEGRGVSDSERAALQAFGYAEPPR
jgi:hypothetical protein